MDTIQAILNAMLREAISPQTAAVAIAAIGLNIHFGFTGLLNIGQSGFMLLGAYGFAISIGHGLPLVVGDPRRLRGGVRLRAGARRTDAEAARRLPRDRDDLGRGDHPVRRQRSALLTDFTGAAQGIQGSQYRDPFTEPLVLRQRRHRRSARSTTTTSPAAPLWVRAGRLWLVVDRPARAPAVADRPRPRCGARIARPRRTARGCDRRCRRCCSSSCLGASSCSRPTTRTPASTAGGCASSPGSSSRSACVVVCLLMRSPWGRVLRGIREDEDAVRSLGKNVFAFKMQALIIGGLFGALGGMIYVLPRVGAARLDGPLADVLLLHRAAARRRGHGLRPGARRDDLLGRPRIIDQGHRQRLRRPRLSIMNGQQTEQFAFILVGVALMLLVIFRPQGILGDKRELRFNV